MLMKDAIRFYYDGILRPVYFINMYLVHKLKNKINYEKKFRNKYSLNIYNIYIYNEIKVKNEVWYKLHIYNVLYNLLSI